GFVLIVGGALYLPYLLSFSVVLSYVGIAIGITAFYLYSAAASMVARDIANYQSLTFKDFFNYFKEVWKSALVISGITIIQTFIIMIAFPFYFQMGGILGVAAMSIIFWVSVVWWLSSQYFFPIRSRLDTNFKKILKKCFMVFFDNTIFTLILGIGTLATFIISGFTAFLLPGITSILIWHQVGFKLRLLKYDYIEENPEADRKKIPWDALLIDEKDRVGQRTLRGMIFPWKE
ncbi:MAG: hypothetical protein HN368_19940, partial [Spirochaetales bacterium]|nr:hypothetical protein [Spirochaetales bacterium]